MSLTLLTATGERQRAWDLCQHWMSLQDYDGRVRWVIVDDGEQPQITTFQRKNWALEFVRPMPKWQLGQNTQARNLRAGLEMIGPTECVVIIEDDDFYHHDWLSKCSLALRQAQLVGEMRARYYNLATLQARQLENKRHASLCSTAMRGSALQTFRSVVQTAYKFIDLELWQRANDRALFTGHSVVGLKGLPGRAGIGMGHQPMSNAEMDHDLSILRDWVGDEAADILTA